MDKEMLKIRVKNGEYVGGLALFNFEDQKTIRGDIHSVTISSEEGDLLTIQLSRYIRLIGGKWELKSSPLGFSVSLSDDLKVCELPGCPCDTISKRGISIGPANSKAADIYLWPPHSGQFSLEDFIKYN